MHALQHCLAQLDRALLKFSPAQICQHYESETALKGVERRWEALAPVATQRL
jgi:hypothetical protein